MRLVVYNIRYATGTGPAFHLPVPGAGYLRSSRQVLEQITRFLQSLDPAISDSETLIRLALRSAFQ